jgi:hypothetical protein
MKEFRERHGEAAVKGSSANACDSPASSKVGTPASGKRKRAAINKSEEDDSAEMGGEESPTKKQRKSKAMLKTEDQDDAS